MAIYPIVMPTPKPTFDGIAGLPLVGGRLYTYAAGTNTPKPTYTSFAADVQQPNPIPLNVRGEPAQPIFWSGSYYIELRDALGNLIYSVDDFQTPASGVQLSSPDGANSIGYGTQTLGDLLKTFTSRVVPSVSILRSLDKNLTTRATTSGYYTPGDGGGADFWYDPADSTTPENGGTVIVAADGGRWKMIKTQPILAKQFGARFDGTGGDTDTLRCQAMLDWLKANGGGQANFPAFGSALINSLTLEDSLYTIVLHNEGSYFEANSTAAELAMLNFVNCVDVHLTGVWRFNGANKNNYRAALAFRVKAGTSQSTTRINVYNPTFRNCPIGISNGEYNIDFQCSEINVFGANFFQTPQPIYNGGSNTGMQLIGCNVTSEANAAFAGVVETSIFQEGGFLKVTGGSIVSNPTAAYTITQAPCQSALYAGNLYGTLDVVGAHVETNAPLMNVQNPRAFATTDSGYSTFKFIGNTGFAGGDVSRDFIYVNDATYAGVIEVKGCNWYSQNLRSGFNMSGLSSATRFEADKTSFGKNFINWLGGIGFGRAIHDMAPVTSVSGLGLTYAAGSPVILKFQVKNVANELGKYGNQYNPVTGTFEVPVGGFSTLQIVCNIAGTGTATGADLYLRRGGATVAFGTVSSRIGTLTATLHDLLAGEILDVVLSPIGGTFTADNGIYNSLQIIGETR